MTKKVLAVAGFGPGTSSGVADLFGSKGFSLALISRTQETLDKAAAGYHVKGVEAAGFATDLKDPESVKATLAKIAAQLGPVTVLFWNVPSSGFGDILTLDPHTVSDDLAMNVVGLIAAVQAVVPGMEGQPSPAILVTGGVFSLAADKPEVAASLPGFGAVAVAAGKAAQRNLVYGLAAALKPKGVRVAEVIISGIVSGSSFAAAMNIPGTVKPADIAAGFWELYSGGVDGPITTIV